MNEQYVARYVESYRAWMDWLRTEAPDVMLIPPVQFAYHDNRGNPVLDCSYVEAEHLAATIRTLMEESRCRGEPVLPIVNATSYNEHYEGTSIEPTLEYRDDWLRAIATHLRPALPDTKTCIPAPKVPDDVGVPTPTTGGSHDR
jgi:hypothetical protein